MDPKKSKRYMMVFLGIITLLAIITITSYDAGDTEVSGFAIAGTDSSSGEAQPLAVVGGAAVSPPKESEPN